MDENIPCLVRLNNRIHPAARGAVANIGLLFVVLFDGRPKFFQFLRRRCFVALSRASKNREDGVGCLSGAHHGIASSWPSDNKTRIISLAAHRVVPGTE